MLEFRLLFFVIFLCSSLVGADYTIDDSDYSTLKYSENPAGPVWGPFGSDTGEVLQIRLPNGTMETIDATQCYDGTYTYAACSTANNCAVQFSFTGSGITIYVLQAGPQGMSASLSIDSGTPTTATLGAPLPPQYYTPNVVLFDMQNIPSGTHSAVMTVLDWNGSFSGMMLDYISVSQAQVTTTSSTPASNPSPSPSPNSTPDSGSSPNSSPNSNPTSAQSSPSSPTPSSASAAAGSGSQAGSQQAGSTGTQTVLAVSSADIVSLKSVFSSQSSGGTAPSSTQSGNGNSSSSSISSSPTSKRPSVAAIVGGTAGGGVGLLAFLGLVFCCIRRRRRQRMEALNERPSPLLLPRSGSRYTDTDPGIADPFAASPISRLSRTTRPLQSSTPETGSTPNTNISPRDLSGSSPMGNSSHTRAASSGDVSITSSAPMSIGNAAAIALAVTDTPTSNQSQSPRPTLGSPLSYPSEKAGGSSGTAARALQREATGTPDVASPPSNTVLTDEQADFVNGLFNNNVPAPAIARVLERMLANPQGVGSINLNDPELRAHLESGNLLPPSQVETQPPGGVSRLPMMSMSDHGDGETTVGTAPPSYDYVQAH